MEAGQGNGVCKVAVSIFVILCCIVGCREGYTFYFEAGMKYSTFIFSTSLQVAILP